MKHYKLDNEYNKTLLTQSVIKNAASVAKKNVDKAEALVIALDLTKFELRVLASRLLKDTFYQ